MTFLQCSKVGCRKQGLRALDSNVAPPTPHHTTHTHFLLQSVSFNSCNINALIYSPHLEREGEMSTIVSIYSSFRLHLLLPLSSLMHRGQHCVSHQGILTEFCCQLDVFATLHHQADCQISTEMLTPLKLSKIT